MCVSGDKGNNHRSTPAAPPEPQRTIASPAKPQPSRPCCCVCVDASCPPAQQQRSHAGRPGAGSEAGPPHAAAQGLEPGGAQLPAAPLPGAFLGRLGGEARHVGRSWAARGCIGGAGRLQTPRPPPSPGVRAGRRLKLTQRRLKLTHCLPLPACCAADQDADQRHRLCRG